MTPAYTPPPLLHNPNCRLPVQADPIALDPLPRSNRLFGSHGFRSASNPDGTMHLRSFCSRRHTLQQTAGNPFSCTRFLHPHAGCGSPFCAGFWRVGGSSTNKICTRVQSMSDFRPSGDSIHSSPPNAVKICEVKIGCIQPLNSASA